ncbi:nuclear transport factor 2 family protein [Streptomyces sp. NPDC101455]|uniref:nuclear transport factor 2 family protein n=1 Tax=Streptomyces sp. NPDC101455 TaxID=3366142 RepID=UPI003809D647
MSASENIAVVRKMYDSKADPAVLQEVIAPDILWDITPGFPGGGVYNGFESVGRDFFGPLFARMEAFYPVGEEYVSPRPRRTGPLQVGCPGCLRLSARTACCGRAGCPRNWRRRSHCTLLP